jgi:hypothetical protein
MISEKPEILTSMAERSFTTTDASGLERVVTVQIGKPFQSSEPFDSWSCTYLIIGLGDVDISHQAFGLDAVHALVRCLAMASAVLSAHAREDGLSFAWVAGTDTSLLKL